jgi:hypothetical protein
MLRKKSKIVERVPYSKSKIRGRPVKSKLNKIYIPPKSRRTKSRRTKSRRTKSRRVSKMNAPKKAPIEGCPSAKYDKYQDLHETLAIQLSRHYYDDKEYQLKARRLSRLFHPRKNPRCVNSAMHKLKILRDVIDERENDLENERIQDEIYSSRLNQKEKEEKNKELYRLDKNNLYRELESVNQALKNLAEQRKDLEDKAEIRVHRLRRNRLKNIRDSIEKRIKSEHGPVMREKSSGSSGSEEFELVGAGREKRELDRISKLIFESPSSGSSDDYEFVNKSSGSDSDKSYFGSVKKFFSGKK